MNFLIISIIWRDSQETVQMVKKNKNIKIYVLKQNVSNFEHPPKLPEMQPQKERFHHFCHEKDVLEQGSPSANNQRGLKNKRNGAPFF